MTWGFGPGFMITMSCSWLKCRMFCWLFTFALTDAEKNKGRPWAEGRSSWGSSCFAQRTCNSAASLALLSLTFLLLTFCFSLSAWRGWSQKWPLYNGQNLECSCQCSMFLPMLRCYIDGGALEVVGEGEGQPDGGWEGKQDGIRSGRTVNAFFGDGC